MNLEGFLDSFAHGIVAADEERKAAKKKNIKHSSESVRWFTPAPIVEAARTAMGGIDLDPASEASANFVVRATRYITETDDGLVAPWRRDDEAPQRVWLNPPGGKLGSVTGEPGAKGAGNRSLAFLFWQRLIRETQAGNVEQAVFLAFNLELLQTTQNKDVPWLGHYVCCVPFKRIAFERHDGYKASPTHGNVIAYVPGTVDNSDEFIRQFSSIGNCMEGIK